MAQRVTEAQVQAVLDTSAAVEPFIATANLIVDENLLGKGLSEARLAQIELWLSAHLATVLQADGESIEMGPLKMRRAVKQYGNNLGLERTPYGHTVMMLDTTNTLINLGKRRAVFRVNG